MSALYDEYWGKHLEVFDTLQPGNTIPLPSGSLHLTDDKLFIFSQYIYMTKRVDTFRAVSAASKALIIPGVAPVGSPGIGKTRYLDLLLLRELSRKKPVLFSSPAGYLFFNEDDVHLFFENKARYILRDIRFRGILALVDADSEDPPPAVLVYRSPMFIVQVAYTRKNHVYWLKQRQESLQFCFKPPTMEELEAMLSLYDKT
ncbi:hypothetical protein B0H10DRAFT_2230295 [Mycena sp. CBHHK59/15]|nr:hypothetical protein B0H10DRAFT_2230295 [Mycena sp. CBHHK59/15]